MSKHEWLGLALSVACIVAGNLLGWWHTKRSQRR